MCRPPVKGDSVTIGEITHIFRRTKLKKVCSDMRKTFGKRFGLESVYIRENRHTVLLVFVSIA
jgi:viroplasmin and RNaseH domain-containing protein